MGAEKYDSNVEEITHDKVVIEPVEQIQLSRWERVKDSFRQADMEAIEGAENMTELQKAAHMTAHSPLARKLKNRHLQMIAIGGAIGTGLFVGSGSMLATGGPAALIIGYAIIGIMLFCTMNALGELAVTFPVSGAFSTFCTRFIDPSWGFAVGWNYAVQWLVVLPLELVAASITIGYWQSDINPAAWVAIFYVLVVIINLFGVRGYGEAEFIFSIIKVTAVIGFIILGIVINCGGAPKGGYIGGKYWTDPGAFNGKTAGEQFKAVTTVYVGAAFSFTGTELAGLAAAETENPRKTLPRAVKQVFWRITLFYIVSLSIVGLLVPFNDPHLLGASSVDIKASPFVIAITNAGISGLPSVFNVVIMIAVISVGNSAVYGCSRTLAALAHQGLAPKFLGYIDKGGRPLWGIGITCVFGLLCFLSASDKQTEVFNWLMALTGLSLIFTWGSVNLCHIRFRRAYKVQGRSLEDIPFRSQVGVYGSWLGLIINVCILVGQFWVAVWPKGGSPNASYFFQKYLAAPIIIAFYIGHKIYKRSPIVRTKDMDLNSGRREVDIDRLQQELEEEKQYIASKNFFYRTYRFWC
ncbi:general amino-acid permease Gap1p [Trichomonascus vanleenenianus]|uniref:amino acid permease n=1 Tax=Trichomonascus vanleenenianus TaxID=2268995 RepID=UPI003ECA4E14